MIGNKTYSSILNEWYSHYLYGQNTDDGNNAEALAAVTVQNNTDGSWSTLDSWPTSDSLADVNNKLTLTNTATGTTTINSNMNGISNWRDAFTSSSTSASAMYATEPVANDTVIKGTVQVKISAAPIQHPDQQASAVVESAPAVAPRGASHEEIMNPANEDADDAASAIAVQSESTGSRDALMMSAMLVDVADDEFTTYPMSRTEVKTGKMNWVGSGAQDYEIINFKTVQSKYKIIARGWIDLANPSAGFDSASAANKISLEDGVYHDYTVYLQPNYYTVKAGHKLALVVYTYEFIPPSQISTGSNTVWFSVLIIGALIVVIAPFIIYASKKPSWVDPNSSFEPFHWEEQPAVQTAGKSATNMATGSATASSNGTSNSATSGNTANKTPYE